jgi:hypothetical protein
VAEAKVHDFWPQAYNTTDPNWLLHTSNVKVSDTYP